MSLFLPRYTQELSPFGHLGQDLAPFTRYFDELDRAVNSALKEHFTAHKSAALPKFNPRFDVKETDEAYQLTGELPGLEQKDITIQFTAENTLSISGRTEHSREESTPAISQPAAVENEAQQPQASSAASDAASENSYQPPTVEDEDMEIIENPTSTSTPSPSTAPAVPKQPEPAVAKQSAPQPPQPRYWLSERSIGTFNRSFPFPRRIDQDAVKASLKNGILHVLVPKARVPAMRRVVVE